MPALSVISKRWSNFSLRGKCLLVTCVPVVIFLFSILLVNRIIEERNAAQDRFKRTVEVRSQLQNLFLILAAAESQVRNYALTGHEEGLEQFALVGPSIENNFKKLNDLLLDYPLQAKEIARQKEIVQKRLAGLKALRAYYDDPQHRGQPPDNEMLLRAKFTPDVILDLTRWYVDFNSQAQERAKADAVRQETLHAANLWCIALGVLSSVLAPLMLARATTRKICTLEASARQFEEGVSPGLAFDSSDELGRLAAAMERAGRTLAAQSQELKLALECGDILIWELDEHTQRIRYQAGSGALQPERNSAELLPNTLDKWIAAIHAQDRERVREQLSRIIGDGGSLQIEYRVIVSGGETRWMALKALCRGAHGAADRRLLGVLMDVTARREASAELDRQAQELLDSRSALQQQTRILQSVLNSMGDGVIVTDRDGKFLVFNPAAREILGDHDFAGNPHQWARHYGLFLPDKISLYPTDQLPFVRAIRGEAVNNAEIFVRPAGAPAGGWVSVTARPMRDEDGEIRGGVLVMRNITAAKDSEDALKLAKQEADDASQAKSEFLSRMSHELRTPLNSILGFAQLLELSHLNDQQHDNVNHILKGGYHLLELINEVLDLARIESRRLSLSPEPVALSEAIAEALDLVRPLATQQDVSLRSETSIGCNQHVQADRQRLKQVLLNLLSNAIKFNRKGGSVVLGCLELPDNKVRVEIVDTGSGISKDGMDKLFRPFERLAADRSDVEGTGLGLALSKRLMEAMGGTIGVESALGVGSKFFIELAMLEDPTAALSTTDLAALARPASQGAGGTVLYIEDNPSNLRLVEQIMSHRPNVRLLSAMQGHLGLDLAELHQPNWILLDLHLPDISGDEVLRRLRLNPRTRHIPVTILSADATPGQISRLLETGAHDYLTKPLDVRRLLAQLEEIMDSGNSSHDEVYAERDHRA